MNIIERIIEFIEKVFGYSSYNEGEKNMVDERVTPKSEREPVVPGPAPGPENLGRDNIDPPEGNGLVPGAMTPEEVAEREKDRV